MGWLISQSVKGNQFESQQQKRFYRKKYPKWGLNRAKDQFSVETRLLDSRLISSECREVFCRNLSKPLQWQLS